jgi:ABC-2 type transport system permease protein
LDITKGIFDRFRSLPIWRPSVLVGSMLGDVVRYAITSVVPLLVGLLLGFRPGGGLLGVVLGLLFLQIFTFSIAWVWTLFGVLLKSSAAVQQVTMQVMFVLVFGSNILVDPRTMPGWLEALVDVNPVSHATTALRGLLAGTATSGQLGLALLSSAILVAIFAPATMYVYNRRHRAA